MRALITGVAGLVGSHLADALVAMNWDVTGVDDLSVGELNNVNSKVDMFINDFASPMILAKCKNAEFDVIFHQAAQARVVTSVEHPAMTNLHNVQKTLELIESIAEHKKTRFVFASSSSVYGNIGMFQGAPRTSENAACIPRSPYALQKLTVEKYLQFFADHHGVESVILRYFNVFGPRASADGGHPTAIASWLKAVYDQQLLISYGDGQQSRDLVYVDDVVDANVRAAVLPNIVSARAYNIASGASYSNIAILDFFMRRFSLCSDRILHQPDRLGDVKMTVAEIRRAHDELFWDPKVDFWTGLNLTIDSWNDKFGVKL